MTQQSDAAREDSLRDYIVDAFKAPPKWAVVLGWAYGLVFLVAAIICAVMMFRTEDLGAKIPWAVFFLLFSQLVLLMKIWFWLMIHRARQQRETERLEARLAELADHLGQPGT
jgi:hypothetical protein